MVNFGQADCTQRYVNHARDKRANPAPRRWAAAVPSPACDRLRGREQITSIPHVFHQPLGADLRAEDVALGVRRHAFGRTGAGGLVDGVGNEGGDRSVGRLADANAPLPAVVILGNGFGFRIGDVDDVVLVDIDAAGTTELRPLVDVFAVLVEDLDAVVVAVPDEQASARIHGERVRGVELAGRTAFVHPGRV